MIAKQSTIQFGRNTAGKKVNITDEVASKLSQLSGFKKFHIENEIAKLSTPTTRRTAISSKRMYAKKVSGHFIVFSITSSEVNVFSLPRIQIQVASADPSDVNATLKQVPNDHEWTTVIGSWYVHCSATCPDGSSFSESGSFEQHSEEHVDGWMRLLPPPSRSRGAVAMEQFIRSYQLDRMCR